MLSISTEKNLFVIGWPRLSCWTWPGIRGRPAWLGDRRIVDSAIRQPSLKTGIWQLTYLYKKHRLRRMAKSFLVEQKVNKISTFLFRIPLFISHPLYLPKPIPTVPSHVHPFPLSSPSPVSSHSNNLCMCCVATVVHVILLLKQGDANLIFN